MVTWGDVLPISKATLPFPISVWHQWSLLLGQGHDVTVGSGAGGEVAPAACTVVQHGQLQSNHFSSSCLCLEAFGVRRTILSFTFSW